MTDYALDSNIISYMLKDNISVINRYSAELENGKTFCIPAVVVYEIRRGLLAEKMFKRLSIFETFSHDVVVGDFNIQVWLLAAEIYAKLKQQGKPIGGKWDGDVLIAAFCIVNDCMLITNNPNHFNRIDGLKFTGWEL